MPALPGGFPGPYGKMGKADQKTTEKGEEYQKKKKEKNPTCLFPELGRGGKFPVVVSELEPL